MEKKPKKIRGPVQVRTDKGILELRVTKSKAVKLRCLDCCGFNKKQVRECDATNCILYEMRSNGKLEGEKAGLRRARAIKTYCRIHCMNDHRELVSSCNDINCSFHQFRKKI